MKVLRAAVLLLVLPALALANVPEIDPGSGATSIALLAGCLLVFRTRKRR